MRRRSTVLVALAVALAGLAVGVTVDLLVDDPDPVGTGAAAGCAATAPTVAVGDTSGGQIRLVVIRPDGSRSTPTLPGSVLAQPSIAPDGQRLVVGRVPRPDGDEVDLTSTLWTMGLDGQDPRPVTEGAVSDGNARWSPDGATIAFTRQDPERGWSSLLTVPADGGEPREVVGPSGGPLVSPAWSPDARRLAYLVVEWGSNGPTGSVTLWTVAADGSDRVEVGPVEPNAISLDWHPDGTRILVSTLRIDDSTLSVVDLATGASTVVAHGATAGRWSREGSHVVHHTRIGVVEDDSWSLVERPFDGRTLGPRRDLGLATAPLSPDPHGVSVSACP